MCRMFGSAPSDVRSFRKCRHSRTLVADGSVHCPPHCEGRVLQNDLMPAFDKVPDKPLCAALRDLVL